MNVNVNVNVRLEGNEYLPIYVQIRTYTERESERERGRERAERERERGREQREISSFFLQVFYHYPSLPIHLIFDIWYSILQQKTNHKITTKQPILITFVVQIVIR